MQCGFRGTRVARGGAFECGGRDPANLVPNRRELEEGTRTHLDLNRLAIQLVADGGLLLSCTCSGLLSESEFLGLLQTAARQAGKPAEGKGGTSRTGRYPLRILARTGAAPDPPFRPASPA